MFRSQQLAPLIFVLVLLLWPLITSAGGAAPAVAAAGSAVPVVSTPVQVAGPSPFRAGCEGAPLRSRVYRNSVVEPMLAVDPGNSRRLVAIWQQDRIATSSSSGVLTAVSDDGGQTWTSSMPTFTRCTGGTASNGGNYPRATDPWLTIAPNGDVYALALAVNAFAGPETTSAMLVSKSLDGGLTWGDPVPLTRDPISAGFNDKGTITADPFAAQFVYAVWDRDFLAEQTSSGMVEAPVMFSRTVDGGQTWEPPRVIYEAPGAQTIGHVLVVLPNGDLLDLFGRTLPSSEDPAYDLAFVRSSDRGATWSAPERISDIVVAPLQDPYSAFLIQPDPSFAIIPSVAVDRESGRLHVAWQDGRFSADVHIDIAYATSADGGRSWSNAVKVNQTTGDVPAFIPMIAVMPDGTAGISHFDLRHASPTQNAILTDIWLVSCRVGCDGQDAWNETHIAGPFDLERAPYARGFFLGDYQGLVGAENGFLLLSAVASPDGASTITHADFVTVTVP
jgi:hypothetical protein